MSENSHFPWSAADCCELHSSGSQLAALACSNGDEHLSQAPEPASGRASPWDDAQPSRGAEGERGGQGDEHLEAATELGERQGEQGPGTGAASESGCEDGPALANGVDTELAVGQEQMPLQQQDGSVPSRSSTDLGERGSPSQEIPSEALSKERWHSVLGSSEALSADEPEEQLG